MSKSLSDIVKKIKESNPDNWNLLIGNGLGLSYDDRFRSELFKFSSQEVFKGIPDDIPEYAFKNPEDFLRTIRYWTIISIVKHYLFKIPNNIFLNANKLKNFLKLFNNISTINYDPIIYFAIQDTGKRDAFLGKDKNFKDFTNSSIKIFTDRKNMVSFLHGGFHIWLKKINSKENSFHKISSQGNLLHTIKKEFNEFEKLIEEYLQGAEWNENVLVPAIILEDRAEVKNYLLNEGSCQQGICKSPDYPNYFTCVANAFKNQTGKLLVYGCSFQKCDHHLIDFLNESSFGKIYITHLAEDKDFPERFKESLGERFDVVEFIKILDHEKCLIWRQR